MTFLEKYELLKKSVPVPAVTTPGTVDSEYMEYCYRCKNCYYCIDGFTPLEDSMYIALARGIKLVDSTSVTESEKCYQCIDCNKCHGCTYLMDCNSCTDCHLSVFLNSCVDCYGCVNLTHKKYCIFNKQYSKEEYFNRVEDLRKEKPEKILNKMFELKQKLPHPASQQFNNENCPFGDYIYNSKNSYWCFIAYYSENSGYCYQVSRIRNSWDAFFSGGNADKKTTTERCYEIVNLTGCYECAFVYNCEDCTNCYYGADLLNCADCFGCVGISKKKYCVLNNQLTQAQYAKAVKVIKKELGWKN